MKRFRLTSLLAGTLTTAIFLGANLLLQISEESRHFPKSIIVEDPTSHIEVHGLGNEWVWVSQGWPLCIREEVANSHQIPPQATLKPWVWPGYSSVQWRNTVANGVIGLTLALTVMAGVEFLLRRRDAKRGAQ